mmetsp:Transcript_26398/g.66165  ORF Transcript_26398/g.66165 Transcript_26398/m.66165 type:complete len:89 (-) Transcript_26398:272-538(-)
MCSAHVRVVWRARLAVTTHGTRTYVVTAMLRLDGTIGRCDWKMRLEDATEDKCNMKEKSREDALAYERKRCRKRCTTCARRIRIWCID